MQRLQATRERAGNGAIVNPKCMYSGCGQPAVRVVLVVDGVARSGKCETHYQRDLAEPWGSAVREFGARNVVSITKGKR